MWQRLIVSSTVMTRTMYQDCWHHVAKTDSHQHCHGPHYGSRLLTLCGRDWQSAALSWLAICIKTADITWQWLTVSSTVMTRTMDRDCWHHVAGTDSQQLCHDSHYGPRLLTSCCGDWQSAAPSWLTLWIKTADIMCRGLTISLSALSSVSWLCVTGHD